MNDTLDATLDREQLVSRNWPERRSGERRSDVDVDLTIPNRRATDRRDDELAMRQATDLRPMANTLLLNDFVQSGRRFHAQPERITAMGDL